MMNLRNKIILFGIIICLITGGIISTYSFSQNIDHLFDIKVTEEENNINIFAKNIQGRIDELKSDVLFIGSTPPIEGILRASSNNGIDPNDNSTLDLWKSRLATIFKELLFAKPNYSQVRYIGVEDEGLEIVRFDRYRGKVFQVEERNLQKKSGEYYFDEAINTGANKIYLSKFSLNREHGKISYPLQMVIRSAMPVYKNAESPFGFIIINSDFTSIFNELKDISRYSGAYFIANNEEQILLSTIENDSSSLPLTIKEIKNLSWEKRNFPGTFLANFKNKILIRKKISYNELNPSEYLSIYRVLDRSELMSSIRADLTNIIILLFTLIVISLSLAFLFSRKLTRPLEKLMNLTRDIQAGKKIDFDEMKVESNDEIGKLTKTLLNLSKDIVVKNHHLTSQKEAVDSFAIVVETDINGKITYVNDKFVEISQYSIEELIGRDHRIIKSGYHSKEFFKVLWTTIKSGHIWRGEIKNKAKDGSYYWVDTTIYPVKDELNQLQKFVAIRYDVTERKRVEEELKAATAEANKASEVKSSFLANMSHEIRTPLNGIIGFSNLLLDKKLEGDVRDEVQLIKDCSEGLLTVINDILDFSKIEAGKLAIVNTSFDIREVVESTFSVFHNSFKKKKINFKINISDEMPKYVIGDSQRIRQILLNLIGNAVKFTPEEGEISLSLHKTHLISDKKFNIQFSIKDNGVGIKKENQDKLFNAFEQEDSTTTKKFGGTGLGLSICQKLVHLMNGKIWFESEYGKGTIFYFSLITEQSNDFLNMTMAEPKLIVNDASKNKRKYKILVAEDIKINQKVLKGYLKKVGQEDITFVENGELAVKAIENTKYDIVFMDIQMPVMDGYEATRKIRQNGHKNLVIAGLSANAFEEDAAYAREVGMNLYLSKPINMEKINQALEYLRTGCEVDAEAS